MLLLKLFILATLCLGINGQTASLYNIYWPSSNDTVLQIQMSFDNEESKFVVNMQIQGDHWAGLGFSKSGEVQGEMFGVDAWIYGDFGNGEEVIEYALGDHDIGTADAQQNLEFSLYSQGDAVQVHIERAYNTGTRDDYDIVEGTELCILWALGESVQVESGHNATTRGEQCFELSGTTQPPTPSPSYYPTPGPSSDPTEKPTNHPTTIDGTSPPSPNPTAKPSDSPTTGAPSNSPTIEPTRDPDAPSGSPTPAPTKPPTKDPDAPTIYPTFAPSPMPTVHFDDGEVTDSPNSDAVATGDAFEAWTWLIVGVLAGLVLCLLAAIVFCYVRNRRQRQKRNKEKEEAYEQLENYRAKHGLDIPDNMPNKRNDDDDIEAGVGNAAQSGVVATSGDSDDEEDDLVNLDDVASPPAYAPPTANGRNGSRGPKKPARRAYRDKDLEVDGMDDDNDEDDTIMADMDATPGGPAAPESTTKTPKQSVDDSEAGHHSKFVDPNKEKRDRIRKERSKRVADRAKLSHNQASESAEKQKRLKKQNSNNNNNDNKALKSDSEDDGYDYEAAKKEREERKRRRESRRNRQKKKQGKFGVFDEDNW